MKLTVTRHDQGRYETVITRDDGVSYRLKGVAHTFAIPHDLAEAALKEVERLWGAKAGTRDGDRLDVLATLLDAYEAEHYPMDPPDPIEAIKFRMEQQGLTRRDLEEIIGTRTRIAEVLNRKRGLSVGMIRRLHERLGISAEVLIRPSRKNAA